MRRILILLDPLRSRARVAASDESGQDVVEYGLMIASVALIVLLGTIAFGNQISPWFAQLAGRITTTGT